MQRSLPVFTSENGITEPKGHPCNRVGRLRFLSSGSYLSSLSLSPFEAWPSANNC